jgi:quinolinate synthase
MKPEPIKFERFQASKDAELQERIVAAKAKLGKRLVILGHHYQQESVYRHADYTGDSLKLSRYAGETDAEFIVFLGVHFMAESADLLTSDEQIVILPDLAAGCSMADMATDHQVRDAWHTLENHGLAKGTTPVVYMNSSAAIKGFTGEHDGTVCTSSNAKRAIEWALNKGERVLFLPDQHLGRNTAVRELGMSLSDCALYDPRKPDGGLSPAQLRDSKMLLWKGHCSVHARFTKKCVDDVRMRLPEVNVLVHPECVFEVVEAADYVGSTERIIKTIEEAPAGSVWAIGTELNLVRRLAETNPDKTVVFLDKTICYCATMNRIDLPHLVATLESLVAGEVHNQIKVEQSVAGFARKALDQMLALPAL